MGTDKSVFISDLHLNEERADLWQAFAAFCRRDVAAGDRLVILGDLVDYWIGDDDDRPFALRLAGQLASLSDKGVELYFMRGNRDFCLGLDFCRRTGMTLLPDPCVWQWRGQKALLTHGDLLCTHDLEYQAARKVLRSGGWLSDFLSMPLRQRIAHMEDLRTRSKASKSRRPPEQLDAVPEAADRMLKTWGADMLVHGHTHNPNLHWHQAADRKLPRYVLSDWRPHATGLILDSQQCRTLEIPPG